MANSPVTLETCAMEVFDLTFTPDTSIMADNDVIAAPQEITSFFRGPSTTARIRNITLLDEDDQGQDIDLVFMNADGSIGDENAVFAPTDAVARTILATVSITASDYSDQNTSMLASGPVDVLLKSSSTSNSLWVGAVCRSGTPTYTAAGLRLKLGVTY